MSNKPGARAPVSYRYDALNWDFIKLMAEIAEYADRKYKEAGGVHNYTGARLVEEKSPVNHAFEHLRMFIKGELHDHFHTLKHQLAALAYNAMMEFYYLERYGHLKHGLTVDTTPAYEKVKTILFKAEEEIRRGDAVFRTQPSGEACEDEVIKEGFKARWEGGRSHNNPYPWGTIKHRCWHEGWVRAEMRILAGEREDPIG